MMDLSQVLTEFAVGILGGLAIAAFFVAVAAIWRSKPVPTEDPPTREPWLTWPFSTDPLLWRPRRPFDHGRDRWEW